MNLFSSAPTLHAPGPQQLIVSGYLSVNSPARVRLADRVKVRVRVCASISVNNSNSVPFSVSWMTSRGRCGVKVKVKPRFVIGFASRPPPSIHLPQPSFLSGTHVTAFGDMGWSFNRDRFYRLGLGERGSIVTYRKRGFWGGRSINLRAPELQNALSGSDMI